MKRHIVRLLTIISILCYVWACDSNSSVDPVQPVIEPIFETSASALTDYNNTFFFGEIDEDQVEKINDLIVDHGFLWSTSRNNSFDNSNSKVISLGPKQPHYAFSALGQNLKSNTQYYVRAYIKMNDQVYYANEVAFKTKPGTWKKLKDFPGNELVNATAFSINGYGYFVGKVNSVTQVWMYDPDSDEWTRKKDAEIYVEEGPTSFVINGKGYVYCSGLYEYNPADDSWQLLIDTFPAGYWRGCGGVSSFVINEKAYIGSGIGNLNEDFVEWDPKTNTSKLLYSFNYLNPNRSHAASFVINGKCYLAGGHMWTYEANKSVIEYDFVNKTSVFKGAFTDDQGSTMDRWEMISFSLKGKGYMGMGIGEGLRFDFFEYEPGTHSWIPQTFHSYTDENNNFSFLKRQGGASVVIGDRAFMGLGQWKEYNEATDDYDVELFKDFWEFIPD